MRSLKLRVMVTFLMAGFGYFLLSSFMNFVEPIYENPSLLLALFNLWVMIVFLVIVSVWIYAMIRVIQSSYSYLQHGSVEEQMIKVLDKEKKSLDVFMGVAEKEFMKRKISRETFDEIQRLGGKKMVELKAKEKEISVPEEKESEKDKQE